MEILQSTLEEIIESEGKLPLLARARYGKFYSNAVECSIFLSNCIAEIDHSRMMFGRFLSLVTNTICSRRARSHQDGADLRADRSTAYLVSCIRVCSAHGNSFDHLVRANQKRLGNCQAKGLGSR